MYITTTKVNKYAPAMTHLHGGATSFAQLHSHIQLPMLGPGNSGTTKARPTVHGRRDYKYNGQSRLFD